MSPNGSFAKWYSTYLWLFIFIFISGANMWGSAFKVLFTDVSVI